MRNGTGRVPGGQFRESSGSGLCYPGGDIRAEVLQYSSQTRQRGGKKNQQPQRQLAEGRVTRWEGRSEGGAGAWAQPLGGTFRLQVGGSAFASPLLRISDLDLEMFG